MDDYYININKFYTDYESEAFQILKGCNVSMAFGRLKLNENGIKLICNTFKECSAVPTHFLHRDSRIVLSNNNRDYGGCLFLLDGYGNQAEFDDPSAVAQKINKLFDVHYRPCFKQQHLVLQRYGELNGLPSHLEYLIASYMTRNCFRPAFALGHNGIEIRTDKSFY